MPRIAGVDLPRKKRVEYALRAIYGIGLTKSQIICQQAGVPLDRRTDDLTEDEIASIRSLIEARERVEGDLRRETQMNIKRLMDLNCFRGTRHKKGLPVRGQRSRTNARTRKGPRRAPIAGKKVATKK